MRTAKPKDVRQESETDYRQPPTQILVTLAKAVEHQTEPVHEMTTNDVDRDRAIDIVADEIPDRDHDPEIGTDIAARISDLVLEIADDPGHEIDTGLLDVLGPEAEVVKIDDQEAAGHLAM